MHACGGRRGQGGVGAGWVLLGESAPAGTWRGGGGAGSEGEGFKDWEFGEVLGKISVKQSSSFQVCFSGSWSPLMGQHQDRAR